MMPGAAAPQGLEAIMAALGTGGMPNGQLGKIPSGVNPVASPNPAAAPNGGMVSGTGGAPMPIPGMPQQGAMDPMAGAMGEIDPQMLQMILQALMQGGAFNSQVPTA